MSLSRGFSLVCERCGDPIAILDWQEFEAWKSGDLKAGLCFDCSPTGGDLYPGFMLGFEEGDCLQIGDQAFTMELGLLKSLPLSLSRMGGETEKVAQSHAPTHARAGARSFLSNNSNGLSSVTYLNTSQSLDQYLSSGIEVQNCAFCGGTGLTLKRGYHSICLDCDGNGVIESAIILPAWILGFGCEGA